MKCLICKRPVYLVQNAQGEKFYVTSYDPRKPRRPYGLRWCPKF